MSHHHDHDHPHEHDHHHHHHDSGDTLTFEQKMIKLLTHWVRHNDDHADNYRDWAGKAAEAGMAAVAADLEAAAVLTEDTTVVFRRALDRLADPRSHG